MDVLLAFLAEVKRLGLDQGAFLGLLHILIGRKITRIDSDVVISSGITWRELAGYLKKVRWPTESVRELGIEPAELAPRDRQQFWYVAIARARVESPDAVTAANRLAEALRPHGYQISSAPGQ